MMDLRKRLLIIISIIVGAAIALLIFFLFVYNRGEQVLIPEEETPVEKAGQVIAEGEKSLQAPVVKPPPVVPVIDLPPEEIYVKQVARMFVERYATYSNQNNNQHIADIMPLVTTKMSKWVENQIVEESEEYSGVTTKLFSSDIIEINTEEAVVNVGVQQIVKGNGGEEVVYKNGTVYLLKSGNDWKVDGFYWED